MTKSREANIERYAGEIGLLALALLAIVALQSIVSVSEIAAWFIAQIYFFTNLGYLIYKGTLTTERVLELILLTGIGLLVLLSVI